MGTLENGRFQILLFAMGRERTARTAAVPAALKRRPSFRTARFLKAGDYPTASAISFVLMAMITVGVLLYAKFLGTEDLA